MLLLLLGVAVHATYKEKLQEKENESVQKQGEPDIYYL